MTVNDHRDSLSAIAVNVTVCYVRPHSGANPDGSTRVSTDPWSIQYTDTAGVLHQTSVADLSRIEGTAPVYAEGLLGVGQCRTGWMTAGKPADADAIVGVRYAPQDFPDSRATWTWPA